MIHGTVICKYDSNTDFILLKWYFDLPYFRFALCYTSNNLISCTIDDMKDEYKSKSLLGFCWRHQAFMSWLFARCAYLLPADYTLHATHYTAGLMSLWGMEQLPFKWKTDQDWADWCSLVINTRDVANNWSWSNTIHEGSGRKEL